MPLPIAFTNARLIDGTGTAPMDGATVVVEGRTITATRHADVLSRGDPRLLDEAVVYDLGGRTLMPGLIDGHVHLLAYAGAGRRDIHLWNVTTFIEEQTLHAAANALIA